MYVGNVLKPGAPPGVYIGSESEGGYLSEEAATELNLDYMSAGRCCSQEGTRGMVEREKGALGKRRWAESEGLEEDAARCAPSSSQPLSEPMA